MFIIDYKHKTFLNKGRMYGYGVKDEGAIRKYMKKHYKLLEVIKIKIK